MEVYLNLTFVLFYKSHALIVDLVRKRLRMLSEKRIEPVRRIDMAIESAWHKYYARLDHGRQHVQPHAYVKGLAALSALSLLNPAIHSTCEMKLSIPTGDDFDTSRRTS